MFDQMEISRQSRKAYKSAKLQGKKRGKGKVTKTQTPTDHNPACIDSSQLEKPACLIDSLVKELDRNEQKVACSGDFLRFRNSVRSRRNGINAKRETEH